MNKDFNKHSQIIHDFRGVVGSKVFDAKYAAATKHLTKNERFLLKMELNRLAAPCTRNIDLRGLVDGNCQLFDFDGRQHFLDELGKTKFKEYVDSYGAYTVGVYERVKNPENSFRNIYLKEQAGNKTATAPQVNMKKPTEVMSQYPSKLYQIDNYPNRSEERMNFAIAITLDIEHLKKINSVSVDISANGIKFKLQDEQKVVLGEKINIYFSGLENEFQFNKNDVFSYQVKNVVRDGSTQVIGCQRIDVSANDAFERFLKGYIQGNKRRYKINLDNTLTALQARTFEQFSMVKLNELVVFMQNIEGDNNNLSPRYALTTYNNQQVNKFWQDENKKSTLHFLLNNDRFERLKAMHKQENQLLVFSFIHQNKGKKYFYTFDEQQIDQDDIFHQQLLAFAASKSSFSITAISYQELSKGQSYSPFTLPNAVSKTKNHLNLPPSNEVISEVNQLSYVVSVSDITSSSNISQYQALGFEGIDLERLKQYGHTQPKEKQPFDEIPLSYGHQRQEMRFKYKTPAVIECEEVEWEGLSADFSVSGLKIELKAPAMLAKDDIVNLTFPKLQKITSAFDLSHLPYKVVRVSENKTVINLRVSVKEHQHIGRSFFKLLIDKNKDKLTPDEYAMLMPGLSPALRTLYGVNMAIPSVMIQSSGSRYKIDSLITGKNSYQSKQGLLSVMSQLSDRQNYHNLAPLLANLKVGNLIDQDMKKLLTTDPTVNELLYIAVKFNEGEVGNKVQVKVASELDSDELKSFFIKKSLKQGTFFCVQLRLSRSEEPNMEFLQSELSYITSYAIHRGKQIEQEIYSVAGLIQLFDVTQETLLRYSLQN